MQSHWQGEGADASMPTNIHCQLPVTSYMCGLQDMVQSYFGMRKISLGHLQWETNPRIMLNNQFIFHMGVLDQVGLYMNFDTVQFNHFDLI